MNLSTIDPNLAVDNTILCIFSINGKVITFRYISEFMDFLKQLADVLNSKYGKTGKRNGHFQSNSKRSNRRLIIFVHNLKYDIYALLDGLKENFGIKNDETMIIKSKIIRLVAGQFEFRDSLVLTGLSLEKSGIEFDIPDEFRKKSGDWDYSILRTPESELTDEEIGYATNDVLALEQIIRSMMKLHGIKRIASLPPTKTGFVRSKIKKAVKNDPEHTERMNFELTDESDRLANRAYHGGISDISRFDSMHYGCGHIGDFDMTSQYPFVLCTQKYPIGDSIVDPAKTAGELNQLIDDGWGFFADLTIHKIKIKYDMISPLLTNDWYKLVDLDSRNILFGSRVYECHNDFDHTVSSVEWQELNKYFDVEISVNYCERFHLSRLPRVFISTILDAYADKTVYKGDSDNETKYRLAKIVVNSIYGICGTSPLYQDKTLDLNSWEIRDMNAEELARKCAREKPKPRFVDYRWAPFCTSYARSFLSRALKTVGHNAIYCDTDSVKFVNENHQFDDWFSNENKRIKQILSDSAKELGILTDRFMPSDKKGRQRPLGVWDDDSFDGEMYAKAPKDNHKLKHLSDGDRLDITSSGISAKALRNFYLAKGLVTPEEQFRFYKKNSIRLTIPAEYSRKLTHKLVAVGRLYGQYYRGDDGTLGLIQVHQAETLFPQQFEKIEKTTKNQKYRQQVARVYDKIKSGFEFDDELESEGIYR